MHGEDSPRRVLCPWRGHPPASTLPAVARATAGRFVRCEWLVGRVVCVPKSPSSGFCVSCSPHGWPSVVRCLGHWRPRVGWTSDLKAVTNWRAPDTETTGWTHQYTYGKAYQPLTAHKAAGRRSSNGRQGVLLVLWCARLGQSTRRLATSQRAPRGSWSSSRSLASVVLAALHRRAAHEDARLERSSYPATRAA